MNPVKKISDGHLDTLLLHLASDRVTMEIHWQLYKDLNAAGTEFLMELNASAAFWTLTRDAHRDMALVRLARLYDPDSFGLPKLVATVRANVHMFDEAFFRSRNRGRPYLDGLASEQRRPDNKTLDEHERCVEASDPLVKRLLYLRNKLLAQRDEGVILKFRKDPFSEINAADVEALRERAGAVIGHYRRLFSATADSTRIVGHDDYKRVLQYVREGMNAARQRIEDSFKLPDPS